MLSDRQKEIILSLFGGDKLLVSRLEAGNMSDEDVDGAIDLISSELFLKGTGENFEVNSYGRELESLIEAFNKSRVTWD